MGKALVYHRTKYLFGVARPGALVADGATLSCLGNDLAPVFSAPLESVTVKKGFGIFSLFVDGVRVAYLTPTGGETSPAPSAALMGFLRQVDDDSAVQRGAVVASGVGDLVGGAAGSGIAAGADLVEQVAVVAGYASGMKALSAYFASIGLLA